MPLQMTILYYNSLCNTYLILLLPHNIAKLKPTYPEKRY